MCGSLLKRCLVSENFEKAFGMSCQAFIFCPLCDDIMHKMEEEQELTLGDKEAHINPASNS